MRPQPTDPLAPGNTQERRHWHLNSGYSSGAEAEPASASSAYLASPIEAPPDGSPYAYDRMGPGSFDRVSSPASPFNSNPSSPRIRPRNHRIRVIPSPQGGLPVAVRDQQMLAMRPRTHTIEGSAPSRDPSPPAIYVRQRSRMGSANSVSNPMGISGDDAISSIGHPSTIPPPSFTATKRKADTGKKLGKINHTLRDPPKSQPIQENVPIPVRPLPPLAAAAAEHRFDRENLLKLMKSSGGKTEGLLAYRRSDNSPWALSFCSINDEIGSLMFEPKTRDATAKILIPDLRGCQLRPSYDIESSLPYLDVSPQNSKIHVHLRPRTTAEWDAWFAALLCWQPIRPKGAQGRMTKPQPSLTYERKQSDTPRHAELKLPREAPVIKFGQMTLWDANVAAVPATSSKSGKSARVDQVMRRRQQVSCQLRESGEFTLHLENDMTLFATVHLSGLSRCAIQRLDPSLLDTNFCIAIFPQYTANGATVETSTPIYLSLESRVIFEAWLVLLRAFTVPQLYGPSDAIDESTTAVSTGGLFRLERALSICIVEARLAQSFSPRMQDSLSTQRADSHSSQKSIYYTDVLLDGELRARTNLKDEDGSTLFWREDFEFLDLAPSVSVISFVIRRRPPPSKSSSRISKDEARRLQNTVHALLSPETNGDVVEDEIVGQVDVFVDDLETGKQLEKWWPMSNPAGQGAGEALIRLVADESVILMASEYVPMSDLLHRFANGLTLQIAQRINGELKRLAECLLSIFQVSGAASEWINNLIEEEVDGTMLEEPQPRIRYPSRRLSSNEAGETTYQNHSFYSTKVRGEKGSASIEANLLFRGNSLATKSLDLHMQRIGNDYLEETIGEIVREIAEKNPDCEVDPNRIVNQNDMDRNWRKLLQYTEKCWTAIKDSAEKCPGELRYIFRNIASCAEDRYGGYAPGVKYSSVSAFLFLRFFGPAILNPKLFGLLKEHPKSNARRVFTLVAKALQGLGNMSTFGSKEEWMEGMNAFLTAHRLTFKQYIDEVCSVSSTQVQSILQPAYSTPLTILNRLPPTSKEGFPSLPHLIDHAKSFSMLVTLWLQQSAGQAIPTNGSDLALFHQQCLFLRRRTENCLAYAERADRPSSRDTMYYEEIVETMESIDAAARGSKARGVGDNAGSRLSISASASMDRPGTSAAALQSHYRGDSFNGKPTMSTRSTSSGAGNSATGRNWRGPGRQLSLEILPSTRQLISRGEKDTNAPIVTAPPLQDHISSISNATSPLGEDEGLVEPEEPVHRSGRTTPSHGRPGEESRIHRWAHNHGLGMSLVSDMGRSSRRTGSESSKERSRRAESRNGNPKLTETSRASSSASIHRPSDSRGNDSDGGARNGGYGGWSAEHVFATPAQRVAPIRESYSRSSHRQAADQYDIYEVQPGLSVNNPNAAAFGSAPRPSSRLSQRAPRRDWTPDEHAKREQRTHGIVSAANSSRAKQRAVFAGSADNSSGDEAFGPSVRRAEYTESNQVHDEDADDGAATALPRFTPQQHAQILAQAHEKVHGVQQHQLPPLASFESARERGEREGRLLERMKWKKRKG